MAFYNLPGAEDLNFVGFTLNTEERVLLANSLAIKANEEKFQNLHLWGKILALAQDYYIAQGFNETPFKRKQDMSIWLELPIPTSDELEAIETIEGALIGDPAALHDLPASSKGEIYLDLEDEAQRPRIREDVRLAGIITIINRDVEIVPRKLYYRDASMEIKLNPSFQGLDKSEIGLPSSYMHFREGFDLTSRTLTERMNTFDQSIDIFQSIAREDPQGQWSIQVENNGTVAIVRNLFWPGYALVHTNCPVSTTSFYYGNGMKNHNFGFMV